MIAGLVSGTDTKVSTRKGSPEDDMAVATTLFQRPLLSTSILLCSLSDTFSILAFSVGDLAMSPNPRGRVTVPCQVPENQKVARRVQAAKGRAQAGWWFRGP